MITQDQLMTSSQSTKAIAENNSIIDGAIRAVLQGIHNEIETCRSDAAASHARCATAIQDANTLYERNAANNNLLIASGTVIKQSFDILNDLLHSLDGASVTFTQPWRSAIMEKINAVNSGREDLERAYSDIHGGMIGTEVRDAAIAQAQARYKKEMADLEVRMHTLKRMQQVLQT